MSAKRAAKLVRRAKRKATRRKQRVFRLMVRAAGRALAKVVIAKRVAEVRKEETPA